MVHYNWKKERQVILFRRMPNAEDDESTRDKDSEDDQRQK